MVTLIVNAGNSKDELSVAPQLAFYWTGDLEMWQLQDAPDERYTLDQALLYIRDRVLSLMQQYPE